MANPIPQAKPLVGGLKSHGHLDLDTPEGFGATGRFLDRGGAVFNIKAFGARGDGVTDDWGAIQSAFDAAPKYSTLIIPEGDFAVSKGLIPREGQTIQFVGSVRLRDDGVNPVNYVMAAAEPNITLINPRLNMDRANNVRSSLPGTQAVLTNYGTGHGLLVIGGELRGGIHNAFQGGRNDCRFFGTRFVDSGEHAIYANGTDGMGGVFSGLYFYGCSINGIALDTVLTEGHIFQIRNYGNVEIHGGDYDADGPDIPSFFLNLTNVHRFRMYGGSVVGLTHRVITLDDDCDDVLIHGITARWAPNAISQTVIDTRGATKVRVIESVFYGARVSASALPDYFDSCKFLEIPNEVTPGAPTVFRRCLFEFAPDSSPVRYLTVGGGADLSFDVIECEFRGPQPTSGGIVMNVAANRQARIVRNRFPEYTANNAIFVIGGKDHEITGNEIPLATGSSVIRLDATIGGTVRLFDNYVPAGGMLVSAPSVMARNNIGYRTENNGTATVPNGQTTVDVNHGLSRAPDLADISVTPIDDMGDATKFWVSNPTATTFTLHVDVDPGASGASFAWQARIA